MVLFHYVHANESFVHCTIVGEETLRDVVLSEDWRFPTFEYYLRLFLEKLVRCPHICFLVIDLWQKRRSNEKVAEVRLLYLPTSQFRRWIK